MVRHVLAWRAQGGDSGATDPLPLDGLLPTAPAAALIAAMRAAGEAAAPGPLLWRQLAAANCRVAHAMRALADAATAAGSSAAALKDYDTAIAACARVSSSDWGGMQQGRVSGLLTELRDAFAVSRRLLRAVGEAVGEPVEPQPQTALADATAAVAGVVAAGVPGAGGYDALYAVVLEPGPQPVSSPLEAGTAAAAAAAAAAAGLGEKGSEEGRGASAGKGAVQAPLLPRAAVERLWMGWPGGGLTPLLLRDGPARGAPHAGLRVQCSDI
jgi:hypothetical protein